MLKHYQEWRSLVESDNSLQVIPIGDGQEIHYMDVLDGFAVLPPRQREAVWLMCVEDKSEAEVAQIMGFKKWPTPVQQYKNFGLARLIDYLEGNALQRAALVEKAKRYH